MPRYYFHLKSKVPSEDEDGIDLENVAAARAEATRFAQELTRVHRTLREAPTSGEIVVTDEAGEEILTLTLSLRQPHDPDPPVAYRNPKAGCLSNSADSIAEG